MGRGGGEGRSRDPPAQAVMGGAGADLGIHRLQTLQPLCCPAWHHEPLCPHALGPTRPSTCGATLPSKDPSLGPSHSFFPQPKCSSSKEGLGFWQDGSTGLSEKCMPFILSLRLVCTHSPALMPFLLPGPPARPPPPTRLPPTPHGASGRDFLHCCVVLSGSMAQKRLPEIITHRGTQMPL